MALPPFTYHSGYTGPNRGLYELQCDVGSDAWDDAEINAAYELEKAAGNIYVAEGEEAFTPGAWVPVTQVTHVNNYGSWALPMSPISPVSPIPTVNQIGLAPPAQKTRGHGKLFKTVFPQPVARKGKLYEAVIAQKGSANGRNEEEGGGTGSTKDLVKSAYLAGYEAGYNAAKNEASADSKNTNGYHTTG